MRVLGIDVGLKRTGLALSDELGISVRFLPNLQANRREDALEKIISLVNEYSIQAVVIGRPDPNTPGSMAIAKRADGLKLALDQAFMSRGLVVTTHLLDEAQTSKRAMRNLVAAQVPQKKRLTLLDAASAAILVEDFLKMAHTSTDGQ